MKSKRREFVLIIIGLIIGAGIIPQLIPNNNSVDAAVILDSFEAPGTPLGLAWDGTYLFCDTGGTIYKINPSNGNVISSITHSVPSSNGLAWDGQYFWVCGDYELIKISPSDGSIIETIPCPGNRGLCWVDWGNYFWCGEDIGSFSILYKVPPSGGYIDKISVGTKGTYGIAIHSNALWNGDYEDKIIRNLDGSGDFPSPGDNHPLGMDSDGTNLWLGVSGTNEIYKLNTFKYPPDQPTKPSGPIIGYIDDFICHETTSFDPDGDQIRYGWDWDGDDIVDEWTQYYSSGMPITTCHSWSNEGQYHIKVIANDTDGGLSDFSESLTVIIDDNFPPLTPNKITGPSNARVNVEYLFSVNTTDPEGDQIKYGWDWDGDNSVDVWSPLMDSGQIDTRSHFWSLPGTYYPKVKVKDSHGDSSDWSPSLIVNVYYQSDLEVQGTLSWNGIQPSSTIHGSFTVKNIGDTESMLNWYVESYPNWGEWTFDPDEGYDLGPYESPINVDVTLVVPSVEGEDYDGEVKIVNLDNDDDYEIIPVELIVPKSKLFNQPLLNFLYRHPLIFNLLNLFNDISKQY